MDNNFLIAGLIFILIMLLGLLALYYANRYKSKKDIRERILETTPGKDEGPSRNGTQGVFLKTVSRFGGAISPSSDAAVSQTRKRLLIAGYYGNSDPLLFFGAKAFLALLFAAGSVIVKLAVLKALPAPYFLILILVSLAAGFYLPDVYLYQRTEVRKRKIFEGFPDALDLMVVCVEAGMGLDAAIKRVGDEMSLKNRVLSDEFKILSLELRVGKPRAEALRNLAMRTDLEEVSGLVALLLQTDKFGTRVAQALRVHSDAMRTKRYHRAEELAAKLPVKIVIPLICFIFPSLLVTIVGPAIIRIYRVLIHS